MLILRPRMKTHYQLDALPRFRRAVVTIGSFDGVHRGHQQLLARIRRMAELREGESVVITFDPHPREILQPEEDSLRLLSTTQEKIEYCAEAGIDHLVVVPFSRSFSQQTPEEYLKNFLVRYFGPERIVIGYDHKFGKDRTGDVAYLRYHGPDLGYEVTEIAAQEVSNITVSSTQIRKALQVGAVEKAAELLGRRYELTGKVVEGRKIGRTIGYPTANLHPFHRLKLIPANGIYAVTANFLGQEYDGMLYIGDRPSLDDGRGITIELHLFDFDDDLYGKSITVEFVEFLRGDRQLEGLEALQEQLKADEQAARTALANAVEPGTEHSEFFPATAIVILNYNGKNFLEEFLPSVVDNLRDNCRVIVADNASTDDSVSWLGSHHPDIELIRLSENHGFAAGYNEALRQVDAELFVLLNSDVRVTPGWLDAIIPLFRDKTIGAVQPKILAEQNSDCFEYAGAAGGYLDFLGYPFCRGRIFAHTERDEGQYDGRAEVFWASGAALFVRSTVFQELGGFEPEYFAHAEEIDLCWRMKRAGYRVMVEPESTVYHVGGGTLNYDTPRKAYLNFRNTLVTSFKNEHATRLIWWLPVRLLLDGLAAILFLSQGKINHIRSILRAHLHFYGHLGLWIKRRDLRSKEIAAARIGPSRIDEGRVADSIALHYYLLGHTRFSQVVSDQVRIVPQTEI